MPERFDHDTLKSMVGEHVDTDAAWPTFVPIPTGKHNTSYLIEGHGKSLVLRIAPPDDAGFLFYERLMMRQEPELHALVRSRTEIPAAEVIAYDFNRTRLDRDYLIMTALPGTPLSDAMLTGQAALDRVLCQTGQSLRQLHGLTSLDCLGQTAYGYLGAHQPMEPQETWAEAFRVMWNKLVDDVLACGCYSMDEAQRMRDLLERHVTIFNRPVESRLLHMDIWAQNILVDAEGNVTGIVDFDRALWGDVEIEFAVLDYCGISEPAFWRGYGRPRDESPIARKRQRFYLLYEVQKYMPIRVWRRNNPSGALRYKHQSLALAKQLASE